MRVLLVNLKMPFTLISFDETCKMLGGKNFMPPLGLITVAALLPSEWQLRLVDLKVKPLTDTDWDWAEMVMVSSMYLQQKELLHLIKQAKERGKPIVAGGPGPTSRPYEMVEASVDFVVIGEAENTISSFLQALKAGRTRGVFKSEGKPDMGLSPVPRFDLLGLDAYQDMSVQTSRGCPFDCDFCDVKALYGSRMRHKSPDQVMAELDYLYGLGWRGEIFISDDNFIGNRPNARAILLKLIPWMEDHGKPFGFVTETSINLGQDLEMIDLMTEANFSHVLIGIETPDKDILIANRKFQNARNSLHQCVDTIRKNGLEVSASFILGFDGEKCGAGRRICEFVEQTNIPFAVLHTLQVMPNTKLCDRLKKEGRLLEEKTTGNSTGARLNYIPTRPEKEILCEYVDALNRLYEPTAYLARAYRSILSTRPTRKALALERGETPPPDVPRQRPAFRRRLRDKIAFFRLLWRQGIVSRVSIQFWRQLIGVLRNNPSRIVRYLCACGLGENFFLLRKMIPKRMAYESRELFSNDFNWEMARAEMAQDGNRIKK